DFPLHAIDYCLQEGGLDPGELDYVGFYDKPLVKFERLLETYLAYAPRGFLSFVKAMPQWLGRKLYLRREGHRGLKGAYKKRIVFTAHHESHAASAFFPSPFEEAAILTLDGVGEWTTAALGVGRGNRITLTHAMVFPHSLGLLYSAFTYFCGFKVNSGEYKLMGLAPYGEPKYAELILEKLVDLKEDGSLRMDMRYFNYCQGLTMTSGKFDRLFGGPPRKPESPLTEREMDLAASIQRVTEEVMLRASRTAHEKTGLKNLCLAGGVTLNCVGNGRILREGPFENIWIQPAAGDAGGALGTALFIWHQLLDKARKPAPGDHQKGSLLGPRFSEEEIRRVLDGRGAKYTRLEEGPLIDAVVEAILDGKVVGWMQDRMEFGPRALGSRSILGDARSEEMQSVLNLKIKFRESFRPFAPSVREERASEYFEMQPGENSPYMLLVAPVHPDKRVVATEGTPSAKGLDRLRERRSEVPAITHVDDSARVQTVDAVRHGRYYKLIQAFEEKTGVPLIINTSFNVRGEPIVCTPLDAVHCFMATRMDVLVLENFILRKEDQPEIERHRIDAYLSRFALD
ncbi:MAG: carbamoyltransferase family protein, partial [Planctomycetota bacterium]